MRQRVGHVNGVAHVAHGFDAENVFLSRCVDHQIWHRRGELHRQLFVTDACRALPAFKAVVKRQVRHVAVNAGLRHLARGQTTGVTFPSVGELDVQAAARALGKVRVPAQAHGLRVRSGVGEHQVHFQTIVCQYETLAYFKRKRPVRVSGMPVAQFGLGATLAQHFPGALPAHAVQGMGVVVKVRLGAVVLPQPAKFAVAQAVGIGHQGVTARQAR